MFAKITVRNSVLALGRLVLYYIISVRYVIKLSLLADEDYQAAKSKLVSTPTWINLLNLYQKNDI